MKKLNDYAKEASSKYFTDPRIKNLCDNVSNLETAIKILGVDGLISSEEAEYASMNLLDLEKNILATSAGCKETTISDTLNSPKETHYGALTKKQITDLRCNYMRTSSILENDSYVVRVNKHCSGREVRFDRLSDAIMVDKEDGRVFRFTLECEMVRDQPYFKDERLSLEDNDEILEMFRDIYKGDGKGGMSDSICESIRNSEESYRNFVTMVLNDVEFKEIYHEVPGGITVDRDKVVGGITVCHDEDDIDVGDVW